MGHQTLPADGPAGRSRGHRLTALLLAPMGARSKTTTTQQPSNRMTKNESAKNSGHYPPWYAPYSPFTLQNGKSLTKPERQLRRLVLDVANSPRHSSRPPEKVKQQDRRPYIDPLENRTRYSRHRRYRYLCARAAPEDSDLHAEIVVSTQDEEGRTACHEQTRRLPFRFATAAVSVADESMSATPAVLIVSLVFAPAGDSRSFFQGDSGTRRRWHARLDLLRP